MGLRARARLRPAWEERRARLADLRFLWGVGRAEAPLLLVLLVALAVVLGFSYPLMALTLGAVVGDVARFATGTTPSISLLPITAMTVLYFAQGLSARLSTVVGDSVAERVDLALQRRLMTAVGDAVTVDHLSSGEVRGAIDAAAFVTGTHFIRPANAFRNLFYVWSGRLTAVASGAVLCTWHWWAGPALVAIAFLAVSQGAASFSRVAGRHVGQTDVLRRAEYYAELGLEPAAGKEIRVFGLADLVVRRHEVHWDAAMAHVRDEERKGRALVRASVVASAVVVSLVFALLAYAASDGQLAAEEIARDVQAVFAVFTTLSLSGYVFLMQLEYAISALGPHHAGVSVARAAAEASQQERGDRSATGLPRHGISVRGLTFRYPGQDRDVIAGLDLDIPAGRSLAIVGANGVGKTTLIKLLSGLLTPTGGSITVDGTDLRELDLRSWQRRCAVIFQDYLRYELPAATSVAFGAVDRQHDTDLLARAARVSGAAEVVAGLPHGWDTVLAPGYVDGTDLSGGQWQRIALARALFASEAGAGVLILDEPTAHLDVRGEAEIYQSFLQMTRGTTTIVISHRFSTVRQADVIAVLDGGRVAEVGTHPELLAQQGRYATMFELQAARFRDAPVEQVEPA